MRIFLLGIIASGKTAQGRLLATQLQIFHISFREFLQEQIMPKMKRPPLIDSDDWEIEQSKAEDNEGSDNLILYEDQSMVY